MSTPNWIEEAAGSVIRTEVNNIPSYEFYKNHVDGAVTIHFDEAEHVYYRVFEDGHRQDIPGVTTILGKAIDKSFALVPWATKLATTHIREQMLNADGSFKQLSTEEFNVLLDEAKNRHRQKLEDAGDIGRIAHDFLERIAKKAIAETDGYVLSANPLPEMPAGYVQGSDVELELRTSMARQCVLAGLDWIRRHRVQFLHAERKIYSRSHNFAGTVDGVAFMDSCGDLECCRGASFKRTCVCLDYKSSNEIRTSYAWQLVAYQFALIEELDLPITHRCVLRLGKTDGRFEPWLIEPLYFTDDLKTFLDALSLYNSLEHIEKRRSDDKRALKALIKQQKEDAKLAAKQAEQAEREAKRLLKLAETDAKKAIKQAEKEERAAAKQAKPAGPVLVPNNIPVLDAEPQSDDHPSTPFEAKAKLTTEGRTGTANIPTGTNSTPNTAPSSTKLDEDFWAGGFGIDASGKQVAVQAKQDKAQPGIAQTVQASAEPRVMTRFWSLSSSTYTGRTM